MLRIVITAVVLCAALLGLQSRAEAHAGCRAAHAAVQSNDALQANDAGHDHHHTHDAPHVPHDEPDGCRHECLACVSGPSVLAAPILMPALPAPAPGAMTIVIVDRFPGGPPPARPFQVPRA